MIKFLLALNKQGRARLAKYYVSYTVEERSQLEKEAFRLIATRTPK